MRPIAYRSKSMSKRKCNYDVHDKELLAIILALEDWRRYIKESRQQTKILTDHKNLVPFMMKKKLNERQVRWKLFLSQLDFKIVYRPEKEGGKPDALTRRPGYLPTEEDERNTQMEQILLPEHYFEKIKIEAIELTEFHDKNGDMIRNAYGKDPQILDIKNALDKRIKKINGVALGLCKWKNEHLWYEGKIWVPEDEGLRTTIISRCHDNPLAGHGGTAKTTELITDNIIGQRCARQLSDILKIATHANGGKQSVMHHTAFCSQTKFLTSLGSLSRWISLQIYQIQMDMIRY